MFNFLTSLKLSRVFILSILFLTFIVFIVVTIFSSFIYNNSRIQLVEALYIQAQSINKLLPEYDENINFDQYTDNLAVQDTKFNCPSEYPHCIGYKCGESWGKCSTTPSQ